MSKILFTLTAFACLMFMSFSTLNNNDGDDSTTKDNKLKIHWISFEEAVKRNEENPKKLFVDLYTDWCTWCLKMEKATFEHPNIAEYINENFYPVKLDAEAQRSITFKDKEYIFRPDEGASGRGVHEIAIYLTRGRLNYPSVIFLDESVANPQPVAGFQNPIRMDKLLKYFGENYYKQIDWGLFSQIYQSPLEKGRAYTSPK